MTLSMQEKSREIEGLRMMLNVDESERLLKLNELKGKGGRGMVNGIDGGSGVGTNGSGAGQPQKGSGFFGRMMGSGR